LTTPSGYIAEPKLRLAKMIAASAAFRTLVSAADADAALASIHYDALPEPADEETGEYTLAELQNYRPCAIVADERMNGWRAERVAEQVFRPSGMVVFEIFTDAASSHEGQPTADAIGTFMNTLGEILEDILEVQGVEPYLAIKSVQKADGPFWGDPDAAPTEGVWIGAQFLVEWGP